MFSVADWISLSLPSRPTASQAEAGFSFFSHFDPPPFFGRTLSSSFLSACVNSKYGGVFCSCVDSV